MKTFKIWDKKESINGVEASYVIESNRIKDDDEIFLILENDRVIAIETSSIIKSVFKLDKNLTVEQVATEYLRIKEEESKQEAKNVITLEEHDEKITKLEKDNADLTFAMMNGGLL